MGELPETFEPRNVDGEGSERQLVKVDKVLDIITAEDFKVTSSPVALDWLMRHGNLHVGPNSTTDASLTPDLTHLPLTLRNMDVENFAYNSPYKETLSS